MCGIVGYTGSEQAAPILLDGLSKLEYRGYDSAGLAVRDGELPVQVVKAVPLYMVPAALVIPAGQPTENLPRTMRIRIFPTMEM